MAATVEELDAIRAAVAELAVAQAEALNALAEFIMTGGPPKGPTRTVTANRVLDAARLSLDVVKNVAGPDVA